jgi:hypothetical protein
MPVLDVGAARSVDSDDLVKIEFAPDDASILKQRADLFVLQGDELVLTGPERIDSIPALQRLRELVGDGSGPTGWVRVRREGETGDRRDAYVSLAKIRQADFAEAPDGAIARVRVDQGIPVGEVHLPAAVQAVRLAVFSDDD